VFVKNIAFNVAANVEPAVQFQSI